MTAQSLVSQASTWLVPLSQKHHVSLRCNNRQAGAAKKARWSKLSVRASGSDSDRSGVSVAVKDEQEALSPGAVERASNDSPETTSASARSNSDESSVSPDSSGRAAQQLTPTSASAPAQKAARDRDAIKALDSYFDKLKATQPKKDEQSKQDVPWSLLIAILFRPSWLPRTFHRWPIKP